VTFSVNPVEAIWIGVTFTTLVLTIVAFFDARADREAVRLLNGKARELAATGLLWREALRIVVLALLLFVALPGLFVDREAQLTPSVVGLVLVPVVLFIQSFRDRMDRKRMTALVAAEILIDRNGTLHRIEEAIARNTEISQAASDLADAAYKEANTINNKLAQQAEALIQQGEDRAKRQGTP
jgi:hypothetical protein